MVQKRSKHGFNTGNTLRSAALHAITSKSSAVVSVKNLEAAQNEIKDKLNELTAVKLYMYNNDYVQYLISLYRTLTTFSYFPDLDVEFSLDKHKCWEILHHLDTFDLPNLWPHLSTPDVTEIFPFKITYKKSHKCKTSVHQYDYLDHKHDTVDDSKTSWKQYALHNEHYRGIQRKGNLNRKKKKLPDKDHHLLFASEVGSVFII